MFLLLLYFVINTDLFAQNTETIVKKRITLKSSGSLKKQKSKLILIDSSRICIDFINDSLFSNFHKSADSVNSYGSSFSITISEKKSHYKQGRCRNIFDTIANHLVAKYFFKYKWRFPEKKNQKKDLISLYLSYATDDRYFLIEIEEFYNGNFLSIYRKKIPFIDLPK
jgi:hypothetical protein